MHSDQTRKDGSSESMIQALYYDFVANYVKTRMYSTRYVQCNSGGHSSADRVLTEELLRVAVQKYCPARDLAIALSVRKLDTSCPLVVGEAGVGVTPGPSHWKSRSMWSCYSLSGLMHSTSSLGSRPSPYVRVLIARGWANRSSGKIRHVRRRSVVQ